MEIQKITADEYAHFLSKNLHTVFHEAWWLDSVVRSVPRFRVDFWGVFRDDELQSVMPVLHWGLAGVRIVRPYLTPYLGPVFSQSVYQGKHVSVISKIKDINALFARTLRKLYRFVAYYPFSCCHVASQLCFGGGIIHE